MSTDLATLKTRLTEASAARHKLMMGEAVVEYQDSNNERVRHTQASLPRLASYIQELEAQISALEKTTAVRPMRVWY